MPFQQLPLSKKARLINFQLELSSQMCLPAADNSPPVCQTALYFLAQSKRGNAALQFPGNFRWVHMRIELYRWPEYNSDYTGWSKMLTSPL